ncbi:MAG: DUF58 domain-containing protein [Candidatus Omnitrophica bacterium]|nr:DUF58 domain-containing protein [Candidatus Omnitrophota bacterium]
MIPKELFRKVRRIEITTSRLVTDIFAGQYHSVFKGQGIEFDEVREYQFGDDVRAIDWNVTARTGRPYVKKYVEERELTVMILVDLSASCRFGSVNMLKSRLAAELAATLAFSAIRNNDKVGLLAFTDEIEKFIPPRKGIQHVLRIIREALYFKPQGRSTDIAGALEYLNKVTTRKAITFLISDFLGSADQDAQDDLKKAISAANKRHDMIAITLNDPRETRLPDCGIVALEDAEDGGLMYVDSSNPRISKQYERDNLERIKRRDQIFNSIGVDHIDVHTDSSYSDALIKFFLKRRRRRLLAT